MYYIILTLGILVTLLTLMQVLTFVYRSIIGYNTAKDCASEANNLANKLKKYQDMAKTIKKEDVDKINAVKNLINQSVPVYVELKRHETTLRNYNYKRVFSHIKLLWQIRKARRISSDLEFIFTMWE